MRGLFVHMDAKIFIRYPPAHCPTIVLKLKGLSFENGFTIM